MLVGDVEELDNLDASEIHARRLNAKEVLMPTSGEQFKNPFEDESVRLAGRRIRFFANPSRFRITLHEAMSTTMLFNSRRVGRVSTIRPTSE